MLRRRCDLCGKLFLPWRKSMRICLRDHADLDVPASDDEGDDADSFLIDNLDLRDLAQQVD